MAHDPGRDWQRGLREAGYVQGQNVAVEYRWAEGHYDRLPELAAEMVRRQMAVIVAAGGPTAESAPTAAAVLHRRWRRSFRLGGPLTGAAICAARAPFRDQYPEERDLQNDLMPQYTCHHMAKQTWRGLGVLLTPMSREDHSTQCDMASRANKRMVLKARDTRHVLRGHLR